MKKPYGINGKLWKVSEKKFTKNEGEGGVIRSYSFFHIKASKGERNHEFENAIVLRISVYPN